MSRLLNGRIYRLAKLLISVALLSLCAAQLLQFRRISSISGSRTVSPVISLQVDTSPNDATNANWNPAEATHKPVKGLLPIPHWSGGRLDSRRMLRIYEWIRTGSRWHELTRRLQVCLATQSSLERIVSIAEVSQKWGGPISMAVYIRISDEWVALNLFVMYMERCSDLFAQTVSIHVAVPVSYEPDKNESSRIVRFPLWTTYPCGRPMEFLGIVMKDTVRARIDPRWPYPQNHMRNVARKTCGTPWVFLTDIDIIPRPHSAQILQDFYDSPASKCSRCQFVIPTFELSRGVEYPESKQELIEYVNKGLARQFYVETNKYGHLATNYSLWTHSNIEESPIKVSHNVDPNQLEYEPFYIGSNLVPAHDERFIGYGRTRVSQVLEAQKLGWTFKVLTPIFVIHWGFVKRRTNSQAVGTTDVTNGSVYARYLQTMNNFMIYKDFVAEV